jgi:hypothetical protein
MAFTDSNIKPWSIDLTTRAGAMSATYAASLACVIFASLGFLGLGFVFLTGAAYDAAGLALLIGSTLVCLVAGFRLRTGQGAYWAIGAFAICALELLLKLIFMLGIAGIVINALVCIFLFQGIRGAFALKSGNAFEGEEPEKA